MLVAHLPQFRLRGSDHLLVPAPLAFDVRQHGRAAGQVCFGQFGFGFVSVADLSEERPDGRFASFGGGFGLFRRRTRLWPL